MPISRGRITNELVSAKKRDRVGPTAPHFTAIRFSSPIDSRPASDTIPNMASTAARLLIVAILVISTSPLYAQRQQQNVAKLKADARNLVGIIGSDKTKTQTYCQIHDLSEQLIQAVQEKDRKKANALAEKIAELYKKMGPEFAALNDIKKHVDLNSRDGKEIASIVATHGESCGGQ